MRADYDSEADALYVLLSDGRVARSIELGPCRAVPKRGSGDDRGLARGAEEAHLSADRRARSALAVDMDSLRPTRHARNEMRHLGLTISDLATMLADPLLTGQDHRGNRRIEGRIRAMRICVVIADDDPAVVVTLFERRRGREG